MKLNDKIIKLRKDNNLSQEEFGNKIDVSRQAISKWENGESNPEIDKIKEISKVFNVSYEYLLNDDIDTQEIKIEESINTKNKKSNTGLKIFLIVLLIYMIFCIYKFIAFYRFYLIANSFSEENYSMFENWKISDNQANNINFNITKVGNKKIQTYYNFEDYENYRDADGTPFPYEIEFTDFDEKICYQLNYDKDRKIYVYHDRIEDMINDEEIEELFDDDNIVRSNTLENIPSGFKQILLASIDPRYYYVSIQKRQFRTFSFANNLKRQVQLNNDYLVESIKQKFEYDSSMSLTFSYDYVQDHFTDIEEPLEEYKDSIILEYN